MENMQIKIWHYALHFIHIHNDERKSRSLPVKLQLLNLKKLMKCCGCILQFLNSQENMGGDLCLNYLRTEGMNNQFRNHVTPTYTSSSNIKEMSFSKKMCA